MQNLSVICATKSICITLFAFMLTNWASCRAGGHFNLLQTKTEYHIFLHVIAAFMCATLSVAPVLLTLFFCQLRLDASPSLSLALSARLTKMSCSNLGKRCMTSRSASHGLSQRKQKPKSSHTHSHTYKNRRRLGTPTIHFFFHLPIHTLTDTHSYTLHSFK